MGDPATIEPLIERVERLLVRYEELQRTNALLSEQVQALTQERDSLKSRLNAARGRVDALLQRLPQAESLTQPDLRPSEMKQIEVQIMGQGYRLGCPEGGEERLQEAVHKVDAAMCKIRDAGKLKARDRIAVLAALNLAFELSDRADGPQAAANDPASGGVAAPAAVDILIARLDNALARDGQLF